MEISLSKSLGCLVGLAIGDALGGTNEFKSQKLSYQFDPNNLRYIGCGPFNLEPGEWTDDTSMALATADSIVQLGKFDANNIQSKFLNWKYGASYCTRPEIFDIGLTTSIAIAKYLETGNVFAGATDKYSSGNGGIMRLAPVAILYQNDVDECWVKAGVASSLTHGSFECIACAQIMADILCRAFNTNSTKEDVLAPISKHEYADSAQLEDIEDLLQGNYNVFDQPSSGYVVSTLGFAMYCFANTNSFADCVAMAASAGLDSDTNAAVAGQIAGAFYGFDSIPKNLVEDLFWSNDIIRLGLHLHQLSLDI